MGLFASCFVFLFSPLFLFPFLRKESIFSFYFFLFWRNRWWKLFMKVSKVEGRPSGNLIFLLFSNRPKILDKVFQQFRSLKWRRESNLVHTHTHPICRPYIAWQKETQNSRPCLPLLPHMPYQTSVVSQGLSVLHWVHTLQVSVKGEIQYDNIGCSPFPL